MNDIKQEPTARRQRSKLNVHNRTDLEEGPGAELHLKWGGDTRPEGVESDVPVKGTDTKESKYVGDGHNFRTFSVGVFKGDIGIGEFLHSVYNPSTPADAGEESTTIKVDYQRDGVLVYREYLNRDGEPATENIGTISVEDWES